MDLGGTWARLTTTMNSPPVSNTSDLVGELKPDRSAGLGQGDAHPTRFVEGRRAWADAPSTRWPGRAL